MISRFSRFVLHHRKQMAWSIAELSRRSNLTQPEISRLETGKRTPTLRHVKGLAEAFSFTEKAYEGKPENYDSWIASLVDLGEAARIEARGKKGNV